jgi:hypothetical protein
MASCCFAGLDRGQGDRWWSAAFASLIVLIIAASNTAFAQTTEPLRLLSVPDDARLLCHGTMAAPKEAAGGARTHWHFEVIRRPGTGDRTDDLWFDSTGAVVSMTEYVITVTPSTGAKIDAIAVTFAPDGQVGGTYTRFEGNLASTTNAAAGQRTVAISAKQVAASRDLAAWFWAHRCHLEADSRDKDP